MPRLAGRPRDEAGGLWAGEKLRFSILDLLDGLNLTILINCDEFDDKFILILQESLMTILKIHRRTMYCNFFYILELWLAYILVV